MTATQHATKAGKDFCNALLSAAAPESTVDGFVANNLDLLRTIVKAQRYAIHLAARGGLTVDEIAEALGINGDVVFKLLQEDVVQKIAVGHIVRPNNGDQLRSGAEAYDAAVCIQVEPFVLVSQHADMRWSTKKAENFEIVGKASEEMLAKCMARL